MDKKNLDHKMNDDKMCNKTCDEKEKHHGKQCQCGCAHKDSCRCKHM